MQLSTERKEKRAAKRVPHKAVIIMACGEGEQLEFEKAELIDCSPPGVACGGAPDCERGSARLLDFLSKRATHGPVAPGPYALVASCARAHRSC